MKGAKLFFLFIPFFLLVSLAFGVKKEFDYYGLRIGMSEDEVIGVVNSNTLFRVDESRYLGKINDPVPFIMKLSYFPYVDNLYIQFYSNRVYAIVIQFNPAYFDYFTLTERLENKYGVPRLKTTKRVYWQGLTGTFSTNTNSKLTNNNIELSLEYPSTVKVMDYEAMLAMSEELSNRLVKLTNTTIIATNKAVLLDEL